MYSSPKLLCDGNIIRRAIESFIHCRPFGAKRKRFNAGNN